MADPVNGPTPYDMIIERMDDPRNPGVPGDIWHSIFMQCRSCLYVTTARRFDCHFCMVSTSPDE